MTSSEVLEKYWDSHMDNLLNEAFHDILPRRAATTTRR